VIRHADAERDAAACAAIYAQSFDVGGTTFEEEPPDAEEMGRRIARYASTHAFLVDERHGQVVGYAYAEPHRERPAYRWAVDVSVYIDSEHRGQGVGRGLYAALFGLLRRQGIRTAVAGIALPNDASLSLHTSQGFEPVGVYRRIGWKLGRWHDVSWWQLDLGEGDGEPAEPLGPQRL
jgi:L-amino acid N-acyltransferase YncA